MNTIETGIWKNNNNGKEYRVTGLRINSENLQIMVDYELNSPKPIIEPQVRYCHGVNDFKKKFTLVDAICKETIWTNKI